MTNIETLAREYAAENTTYVTLLTYHIESIRKEAFLAGVAARQQEIDELVAALTKIKDVLDEYGISPTDIMLLAEATNALKKH
jgi:hypothetical protein